MGPDGYSGYTPDEKVPKSHCFFWEKVIGRREEGRETPSWAHSYTPVSSILQGRSCWLCCTDEMNRG